ncbi:MAG: GGDEF domain-containing protein [Anaerolineales bacterium]
MQPATPDRFSQITDQLRANLFPRIDPELRVTRTNLAGSILTAQFALLGLWAVGLLLFRSLIPDGQIANNLAGIAFLAGAGALALWLLRKGSLNRAGYVISLSWFLFVSASAFLVPEYLVFISAAFFLPILASGAVIGGWASFVFAFGSVAANSVAMVYANSAGTAPGFVNESSLLIYMLVFAVVALSAALISNSLSEQIQRSLSSLHQQADLMAKLAHTDPLTGLSNRRRLFEQLESEFTRAQRYRRSFCLLYIDMDGFKAINDQFGHLFGDEILRGSARAMQAVLRATDLLARIGGDEFAVLLPETDIEGAEHVAEKLRKALAAYGSQLSPSLPSLTLSVGVGQISEEDDAIEDVLARADKAQYLAKSVGKSLTRTQEDLEPAGQVEQA